MQRQTGAALQDKKSFLFRNAASRGTSKGLIMSESDKVAIFGSRVILRQRESPTTVVRRVLAGAAFAKLREQHGKPPMDMEPITLDLLEAGLLLTEEVTHELQQTLLRQYPQLGVDGITMLLSLVTTGLPSKINRSTWNKIEQAAYGLLADVANL